MVNRREILGVMGLAALAEIASSTGTAAAASSDGGALPAGAKVPAFAFLYECTVTLAPV